MKEVHGRAIVVLLAAILSVMLFGASAVLASMRWGLGIAAALCFAFLVIAGGSALLGFLRTEIATARAANEPWITIPILWLGIVGNFAVAGIAALIWLAGGVSFGSALVSIPFYWLPLIFLFGSLAVSAVASAPQWLPKVPGRIAGFFRGWLMLAAAPALGPWGRWQNIREARARGEQVGIISAGANLMATFAVGVVLWLGGVLMPLLLIVVIIIEAFR